VDKVKEHVVESTSSISHRLGFDAVVHFGFSISSYLM